MKKGIKITLIIIGIILTIIVIDSTQAKLFKNSPIIRWRTYLDGESYVDKGILIDTYYCVKDKDNVDVSTHFKTVKFACPLYNPNNFSYEVITEETKKCDNIPVLYYETSDENIYTYCLDKISFTNQEESDEVRYFLNGRYDIYNEFLNSLKVKEVLDNGITIYEDNKELSNNGLTIIKCDTKEGNKDVYIGPRGMKVQTGFCKRSHKTVLDFIRTYIVKKVEDKNDYFNLTLSEFQGEQNVVVKVSKKLISKVEPDQYYEFTFKSVGRKINEDIKTIFDNATLIKISKSNKVGLDAYMDSVR